MCKALHALPWRIQEYTPHQTKKSHKLFFIVATSSPQATKPGHKDLCCGGHPAVQGLPGANATLRCTAAPPLTWPLCIPCHAQCSSPWPRPVNGTRSFTRAAQPACTRLQLPTRNLNPDNRYNRMTGANIHCGMHQPRLLLAVACRGQAHSTAQHSTASLTAHLTGHNTT